MPLKLAPMLERQFVLELPDELDPEHDTFVTIRQATRRETEALAAFQAERVRTIETDGRVQETWRWSFPEQQRYLAYLTMVDSNILDPEGELLFKTRKAKQGQRILDMNSEAFKAAWGSLPDVVANAIYAKVIEMNPHWGPEGEVE